MVNLMKQQMHCSLGVVTDVRYVRLLIVICIPKLMTVELRLFTLCIDSLRALTALTTLPIRIHVAKTTGASSCRPHGRSTAREQGHQHGLCEEISRVHGTCVLPGKTGRVNG